MNWIKDLKNKTWIDWVKIVVAIDIVSTGLGLIVGLNFHILAGIFGFISRIFFGVMYIFVATLMLKKVFPFSFNGDVSVKDKEETTINNNIKQIIQKSKQIFKKFVSCLIEINNALIDFIDSFLDKVESFYHKKKEEIKKEVHNILNKK